jgi:uncharacterized membrane protein YdjX (TVP38/TMEM64 family)
MVVLVVVLLAGLAAWSTDLHHQIIRVVEMSEPVFARHPVSGALLFIGLAALSAAVVFFSTVLLVPFGISVWGEIGCFFLLWTGWFLGGMLTYTIGRRFGRPFLLWMLSAPAVAEYEARIPASHTFLPVLLAQVALPSEAVGYLCGILRVPPRTYLMALALAEVPYALGTVLLGAAFFRREYVVLVGLALAGLILLGWLRWRRRPSRPGPPSPAGSHQRVAPPS